MTESTPSPWKRMTIQSAGGLTEVGFSDDEHFVLIVSWQGRGVLDARTGEKVARDHSVPEAETSWLRETDRVVVGIGPIEGEPIRCVGLWGGSLLMRSGDFDIDVIASGNEIRLREVHSGVVHFLWRPVTEIRAAGFSPSGEVLVIATSSDIELLRRAG